MMARESGHQHGGFIDRGHHSPSLQRLRVNGSHAQSILIIQFIKTIDDK
jgi:hypothetical protein